MFSKPQGSDLPPSLEGSSVSELRFHNHFVNSVQKSVRRKVRFKASLLCSVDPHRHLLPCCMSLPAPPCEALSEKFGVPLLPQLVFAEDSRATHSLHAVSSPPPDQKISGECQKQRRAHDILLELFWCFFLDVVELHSHIYTLGVSLRHRARSQLLLCFTPSAI